MSHIRDEHDESASSETFKEGQVELMEPYSKATVETEESNPQSNLSEFALREPFESEIEEPSPKKRIQKVGVMQNYWQTLFVCNLHLYLTLLGSVILHSGVRKVSGCYRLSIGCIRYTIFPQKVLSEHLVP